MRMRLQPSSPTMRVFLCLRAARDLIVLLHYNRHIKRTKYRVGKFIVVCSIKQGEGLNPTQPLKCFISSLGHGSLFIATANRARTAWRSSTVANSAEMRHSESSGRILYASFFVGQPAFVSPVWTNKRGRNKIKS